MVRGRAGELLKPGNGKTSVAVIRQEDLDILHVTVNGLIKSRTCYQTVRGNLGWGQRWPIVNSLYHDSDCVTVNILLVNN